ncbi:hypothetical protein LEMLEM_LOCUS2768, partial [Lemmus lemmus]
VHPAVRTPSQLWSSVVSLPTLFLLHHFQIQPFVLPKEDVCSLEGCGGLQLRLAEDLHSIPRTHMVTLNQLQRIQNGMHVVYIRVCKENIHTYKFPVEGSGRQHLLIPALISLERHPMRSWHAQLRDPWRPASRAASQEVEGQTAAEPSFLKEYIGSTFPELLQAPSSSCIASMERRLKILDSISAKSADW